MSNIENPFAFPNNSAIEDEGMTLRDYFAAKAMTQIIASDPDCKMSFATVASLAYQSADAMLAERAK
mgnify:CR=1 FL=1